MSMKRFAPKTGNPMQKSRETSRKLTRAQDSKQDMTMLEKGFQRKMKRRRILQKSLNSPPICTHTYILASFSTGSVGRVS
jgi:hypothetical protein